MNDIKKLPILERPYEKLKYMGSDSLSNIELLAIILKTGKKDLNSLQLSQMILSKIDNAENFNFLQDISLEELKKFPGIGEAKAIELVAVGEISKRINCDLGFLKNIVSCPKDIYRLMADMQYEKQEILKCLLLNKKNKVICIKTIYIGNLDSINIDPKVVLCEAVRRSASKIAIVHNHPSGDSIPSNHDIESSRRLSQCAKLLDIELLDHIVIGKNNYCSIRQYLGERNETFWGTK